MKRIFLISFILLYLNTYAQKVVSSSKGKIQDILISAYNKDRCYMLDLLSKLDITNTTTVYFEDYREYSYSIGSIDFMQQKCNKKLFELYKLDNETYLQDYAFQKKGTIIRINKNDASYSATKWVQDNLILKSSKDYIVCMHNSGSKQLLKGLEEIQNINKKEIVTKIQGGNILFYKDIAFIGKNDKAINNERTIKNELGLDQIIWVGSKNKHISNLNEKESFQANFHIDLFMNLIQLPDTCLIILSKVIKPILTKDELDWNYRINEIEKNISNQLKLKDTILIFDYIPLNFIDKKHFYSFSNSIIEIYNNKRTAYIPYYDYVNQKDYNYIDSVYNKYNIKTKYIKHYFNKKGFDNIIEDQGSLHCLTKILRRVDD